MDRWYVSAPPGSPAGASEAAYQRRRSRPLAPPCPSRHPWSRLLATQELPSSPPSRPPVPREKKTRLRGNWTRMYAARLSQRRDRAIVTPRLGGGSLRKLRLKEGMEPRKGGSSAYIRASLPKMDVFISLGHPKAAAEAVRKLLGAFLSSPRSGMPLWHALDAKEGWRVPLSTRSGIPHQAREGVSFRAAPRQAMPKPTPQGAQAKDN